MFYLWGRDNLRRCGWNVTIRPTVLLIFWVIFVLCPRNFNLIPKAKPRPFWKIVHLINGKLLNKRVTCSNFLDFLLNITCCTFLVESGLETIFHWKPKLFIEFTLLLKLVAMFEYHWKKTIVRKMLTIRRKFIW